MQIKECAGPSGVPDEAAVAVGNLRRALAETTHDLGDKDQSSEVYVHEAAVCEAFNIKVGGGTFWFSQRLGSTPSIPDSAIVPEGALHFTDRNGQVHSGKSKGGGVCFMVNIKWCSDVEIISTGCSPDLEHLMIRCRPYYLPREFTSVVMTAVYVPPQRRQPTRPWTSCLESSTGQRLYIEMSP
ncbi:hypothetical protein L3Q82_020948 [Scortum barcoo]|uniref:Uncharacterized protein n=1 Tax=Scortum barcoo TaxID=214431 RepID=A0ACB8V9A4_9TELE|nr:hypothetical protein L3Q82_020948 [Scortum barcoo]